METVDVPCDADLENNMLAAATDACGTATITFSDELIGGGCAGQVIRTYTATDACDNSSEFVQTIILVDETAPVASNDPADLALECGDSVPDAEVLFTDNCDEELSVIFEETYAGDSCDSTITRTWIATDLCANQTIVDQIITITDNTAPAFTFIPENITHECSESPEYGMAEATDNCNDVTVTVTETEAGDACENIITRTFTATDACGNSSMAVQQITVLDTQAPTFTSVPEYLEHSCDESPVYEMATATDNCSDVAISVIETIQEQDACETILYREFTATDALSLIHISEPTRPY